MASHALDVEASTTQRQASDKERERGQTDNREGMAQREDAGMRSIDWTGTTRLAGVYVIKTHLIGGA